MNIGLIDVDGHSGFPNLPLMKLSAWHKSKGDNITFYDGLFGGKYDKVYMSKVFDFTKDYGQVINAGEIIKGGTGYNLNNYLPNEIENFYPDYSLYNIKDNAYGFLTRGCPRQCSFCIVSEKEGKKSVKVAELSHFWTNEKLITLLDPNLLACNKADELLQDLINSNANIDFTQGLDIRHMTNDRCVLLNAMRIKKIHFAWDNYEFKTYELLKKFRPLLDFKYYKLGVYVLCNFNTTHEQDLERVYKIRDLGYDPYVMIYDRLNSPRNTYNLQLYVNVKRYFYSIDNFNNFNIKTKKDKLDNKSLI